MKKLAIMLAASTFLVGAAHAETLRVGTSADFAPWESVDASGAIVGFDIDVANEICTRIEAECEFTNQAFDKSTNWNDFPLNKPKSDNFRSGITSNAIKDKLMNGALKLLPNAFAIWSISM